MIPRIRATDMMTVPLTKQEVCRTVLSVLGNRDSAVNNICKMASL